MWVKYTGKITYNSMEVRGFKSNASRSVTEEVGKYLTETFPKLFRRTKPIVVKEVSKDVEEEKPKEEVKIVKGKSGEENEEKSLEKDEKKK